MQGSKYPEELKEKAYALIAAGNTASFAAKQLNLPYSTVKTWELSLRKSGDGDGFAELRQKNKEGFIQNSWKVINLANTVLERRLERAANNEELIDKALRAIAKSDLPGDEKKALSAKITSLKIEDVGKIAVVLGTLYDKQALANKEATAIVEGNVSVKKFEDYE